MLVMTGDIPINNITDYHDTKTSCFTDEGMVLYNERKAFYDTKTTCFTVIDELGKVIAQFSQNIRKYP